MQDSAKGNSVGLSAQLKEGFDNLQRLKKTVGYMIPNICASDTAARAAWDSAAQTQRRKLFTIPD